MDGVRLKPRSISLEELTSKLTPGRIAPAAEVSEIKDKLKEVLTSEGYKVRTYNHTDDIDCFAFMQKEVPFREEPILIDDGGLFLNGQPILRIMVLDAEGANRNLNKKIETLSRAYVSFGAHSQSYQRTRQNTVAI